ncbi:MULTISPECIES: hypothetical protein [unclassified Luteococcus]|uniref:hypothetical protein n=1 Tax=unclassified Luteococcus TaxID=2639923 RepID=UPI00313D81DE
MTARPPHADDFDARADALFRDLTRETDDLLTVPSPAEIRRRGDQRRTRRRTGIAVGTLGIGVLAAASAFSLTGGPLSAKQATIDPAGSPSPTRVQLPTSRPSQATAPASSGPATPSASPTANQPSPAASSMPASTATPTATVTTTVTSTPSASGAAPSSPQPAASSLPATAPAPTGQDLPTAADLSRGSRGELRQDVEATELPQEPFSMCQVDIKDLAHKNLTVRHFTSSDGSTSAYAVVFGYDTAEQAVAARRVLRGWYTGCAARLQAAGKPDAKQTGAFTIPLSGRAGQLVDPVDGASFRQVSHAVEGGTGVFEEATVIQAANRLEWVVYTVQGSDNNWDTAAGGPVGAIYPGIAHAQSWADTLLP